MNNFKNRGLFIVLTLSAFLMLALASYTLSVHPKSTEDGRPTETQQEAIQSGG